MRNLWTLPAICIAVAACTRKPKDEDLLRKRIDAFPVHLYLASKLALGQADREDVKAAREQVLELLALASDAGKRAARPADSPAPDARVQAKDAAKLVGALWKMRALGKEALEKDRDDYPAPVLPVILAALWGDGSPIAGEIDPALEHALLFVGLTALKVHPKSPVPIPAEILLYEAWKTRPGRFAELGFDGPLHSLRAYTFANERLCDLSAKEAGAISPAGELVHAAPVGQLLSKIHAGGEPPTAGQIAAAGTAFRWLAEGSTAICYFEREQYDEAHRWLGRFLDTAERAGIRADELTLLRAYLDCAEGDSEQGKRRLDALSQSMKEEDAQIFIAGLQKVCGKSKGRAFAKQLDRALFAAALMHVARAELERSGLLDRVAQSPFGRSVSAFANTVGGHLASARGAIPDRGDIEAKAKSLFQGKTKTE